jgi:hypothetical protein
VEHIIYLLLSMLVSAFVGSYLAGYLRKKGENLATHEDINKLVAQVAAVTTATKEIEAKISNEVWERQRRWEIKKDAVFETMRELSTVLTTLGHLMTNYSVPPDESTRLEMQKMRNDAYREYQSAHASFVRARMLAMVVSGKEVRNAFDQLELKAAGVARDAMSGEMGAAWDRLHDFILGIHTLARMVRSELHVDESAPEHHA